MMAVVFCYRIMFLKQTWKLRFTVSICLLSHRYESQGQDLFRYVGGLSSNAAVMV